MIKAVVFDLDDTLASELLFVKSGYKAVAEYLKKSGQFGKASGEELYLKLWCLFEEDSKNVFNRLYEAYQTEYSKENILELVKIYREHKICQDIYREYEDVLPCLETLKKRGCLVGILSDGFLISQQNKVKALGYDKSRLVDEIVLTDELGREYWKPSEKGFLMLCDRFGIRPNEMLYVGDNPNKDFLVKKNIDIKTARIIREKGVYAKAEYKENIREDFRVESLEDVCALWE